MPSAENGSRAGRCDARVPGGGTPPPRPGLRIKLCGRGRERCSASSRRPGNRGEPVLWVTRGQPGNHRPALRQSREGEQLYLVVQARVQDALRGPPLPWAWTYAELVRQSAAAGSGNASEHHLIEWPGPIGLTRAASDPGSRWTFANDYGIVALCRQAPISLSCGLAVKKRGHVMSISCWPASMSDPGQAPLGCCCIDSCWLRPTRRRRARSAQNSAHVGTRNPILARPVLGSYRSELEASTRARCRRSGPSGAGPEREHRD